MAIERPTKPISGDRLSPIERLLWESQSALCDPPHWVIGPSRFPPFWKCGYCGVTWSNGGHPPIEQPDLEPIEEDLALPYWHR